MANETFPWEPAQYSQFADLRNRPFFDLTSRIAAPTPQSIVDLGCGPGTLTATLGQRWPQARVLGLDNSAAMLQEARTHTTHNVSFAPADIAQWMPETTTDIVVSNAALQWVPQHRTLLTSWLQALRPGAWLAVQVPGNFAAPSHALMRELAVSPRWRKQLAGILRHDDAVAEPSDYRDLFLRHASNVEVWETTYQHLLPGPNPVLEWVRGTGLRPILNALDPASRTDFEQEYSTLLTHAYPAGDFGTTFPFRRIFMVGQK